MTVAVTGHIKPVARPAFPVVSRCQEGVNDLREGLRRFICKKCRDLLRRGRQAGEIQKRTANEQVPLDWRVRLQPRGFQPGEDKAVHIILNPCGFRDLRLRRFHDGPERPVAGAEFRPVVRLIAMRPGHRGITARPGRTHLHPLRQDLNLRIVQLRLRRHGHVFIPVIHRFHNETLRGITWRERRTGVPAFLEALQRIHAQPCLELSLGLRLRRVAAIAMLHQQRSDLVFEEFDRLRRGAPGQSDPHAPGEQEEWIVGCKDTHVGWVSKALRRIRQEGAALSDDF